MAILPAIDATDTATREIILDFLKKIGVSNHFASKSVDPAIKKRFFDTICTWDLGIPHSTTEKHAKAGLDVATFAYRHTPIDVQVDIAIYTFLLFMVDDGVVSSDTLREFSTRCFDSRPQMHPILTHVVQNLTSMRNHYSSYSSNAVIISTLDFVNAEMFGREGGTVLDGSQASEYIDFIRWKNGLGEAYTVFIWPRSMFPETKTYIQAIPQAVQFICLANDLLSFHKESKAGEKDNYVNQHAKIHKQSVHLTLLGMVDRLAALNSSVKTLLGTGPEVQAWEAFVSGYTEFHFYSPRYSLKEIVPEYY